MSPRIGLDWIRTSDIAIIDADDFLFLRGRADGAIIRGSFKLLPETIERALQLHPAVAAAAVIGLRDHLLATHIPVAWRFVEEMPRAALSLKVDQGALRRLLETTSER